MFTSETAKAQIAFLLTTIGGVATFLLAFLPDNDNVQLWGGIIAGVVTVLITTYGVYAQTNAAPSRRLDG